eukprot:3799977-Ditylum_brightwellii.AAC.1
MPGSKIGILFAFLQPSGLQESQSLNGNLCEISNHTNQIALNNSLETMTIGCNLPVSKERMSENQ